MNLYKSLHQQTDLICLAAKESNAEKFCIQFEINIGDNLFEFEFEDNFSPSAPLTESSQSTRMSIIKKIDEISQESSSQNSLLLNSIKIIIDQ